MRKTLSIAATAVLFLCVYALTSCNKSPFKVDYNLSSQSICLPANPYQTYTSYTFPISHSSIQSVLGSGVSAAKIASANVKGLVAQVTTTGADFSQISSIEVYMKLASDTAAGYVGQQVAYTSGLPATGLTHIGLNLDGANIDSAFSNDMIMTVKVLPVAAGNSAICFALDSGYVEFSVNH